ncbi:MAG: hypothetical protein WA002_18975 [Candidatus Acidiferrales bacterium]
MLLATMLVLFQMPIAPPTSNVATPNPAAHVLLAENLPAVLPLPAPATPASAASTPTSSLFDQDNIRLVNFSDDDARAAASAEPLAVTPQDSQLLASVHVPTHTEPLPPLRERKATAVRERRSWLLLGIAEHGAATFDAWTTNRAVAEGHSEDNPLLRPFAGSASMYAAIQVGPVLFDYIGRRMQRSETGFVRRIWWLPQTLSLSASIFAGAHNLAVTK